MSPHSTFTNLSDASPNSARLARRRGGGSRLGSRFRGVTHHSRTARYESHLWDNGKQVYLGGFNIEAAAALAYDLAGVSYRGHEALLNGRWSLVEKELQARHTISREDVIQKLRTQSKHMNKINQNPPLMKKAELLVSQAMNPNMEHLGLFRTADEAARAYDRALIERLGGVLASSFTNFPLYEYLDVLSEEEIQQATAMSIIPAVRSDNLEPAGAPTAFFNLNAAGAEDEVPFDDEDGIEQAKRTGRNGRTINGRVGRKESETSVLNILADVIDEEEGEEVGVKRDASIARSLSERGVRRSKRSRPTRPVVAEEQEDDEF